MTKNAETGVDELDPTNTAGDGSSAGDADPKRMVPLAALEAERKARQKLATELARVSGTVEGLKAGQQKPSDTAPKVYTRAELRALVTEGKITEDQMDAQLETQFEARANKRIDERTAAITAATSVAGRVGAEISSYLETYPDLSDPDSEIRAKVQVAFNRLVSRGAPEGAATELTAMEIAIGSIAPKGRNKTPESHEETGGSGDDGKNRGGDTDGWAKGLSAKQKAHYQTKIDRGIYKGTTDKSLLAEVKIAAARH